jgi:hypothetical protein
VLVAAGACATAWFDDGSVLAKDWLPYAVAAALLAAVVLLAGAARPSRAAVTGLGLLLGLAAWQAVSAAWSPVPALARDEALLTTLFVLVVAIATFSLRTPGARMAGLWVCAVAFGGFAVVVGLDLALGSQPLLRFFEGRLYFPITYSNAQAALFLAGFWPAIVLGARRSAPLLARAAALGLAAAAFAGSLLAQSKGSVLGVAAAVLVVAILSPARLRILLAALLGALPALAAFPPLTAPFRHQSDPATMRHAGLAVIGAALAGAGVGVAYGAVDRRLDLTARREAVSRTAAIVTIAAALAGSIGFVAVAGSPISWIGDRWSSFKTYPAAGESGATHLENLGSYRYDFWRASLEIFERHPVAGCGARCFGVEYLLDRQSPERPKRAHSLYLDTAAETGVIGLVLLVGGLSVLMVVAGRGARLRRGPALAALAGVTGFLAQSAVDWTWTFPAVGMAYALLLGIGISSGEPALLPRRIGRVGAGVALALALLAFAPPWLSARLTASALKADAGHPAGSLVWARRLDPLSTAPLTAQALLATNAADELRKLREAVAREPRVVDHRYFLGVVLLNLGRRGEARVELRRALALDPGNPSVELALARTR